MKKTLYLGLVSLLCLSMIGCSSKNAFKVGDIEFSNQDVERVESILTATSNYTDANYLSDFKSSKDNKEITINNYQTSKEYLTKTWNISIKNNNIYLDLIKDDTSSIYEKNLDNTQSNSLFTTKNIFSYIKLNDALVLTTLDEKESSTLQVVKNNQSILTKDYAGVINIYKVSSTKVLIESNNKYEIYNLENNKIQEITFNEDISGYKIRFLENNNLLITNDLDSKIIEITT